jgi:methionine-S-sulfoxide reductase
VLRTRVGYTGGSTENPTYHNLGDHIETVEVDFDPSVISYGDLLDAFWASHDPRERPWKRQYMSAIFPHNDEQKNLAIGTRSREAARRNGKIYTEILPASRFYLAEAYHQKYMLRGRSDLMKEYEAMYPSFSDFLASRAVTRVNGYVAGNGTCDSLRRELDGLGLSPAGRKRLEDIVCPNDAKKGRSTGEACPAG